MGEKYEVITYEHTIGFNYTLPGEDEPRMLEKEVTLVWEDTLESFFQAYTKEKPYTINEFHQERSRDSFIQRIEDQNENLIDEVDEEIAQKMKFGFEYTSPTYED